MTSGPLQFLDPQGMAVFFSLGDRPFVFNGNSGELIDEVPPEVGDYLEGRLARPEADRRLDGSGWMEWLDAYRDGSHPDLAPEVRQTAFLEPGNPGRYVICVAQACNLACGYCINQRGAYGGKARVMRPAVARECTAYLQQQLRRDDSPGVSVVLFGGEPLLARESLRILVDGLLEGGRETGKPVGAVLCSNGTMYDAELARVFAAHHDTFSIAVSIDGDQETHDRQRPFAVRTGKSSWLEATRTVRRLIEDGVRVSVTCVVPAPYDYVRRSEELHALGVRRIEIKPVIPHVYGCAEKPDIMRSDFALWREKYLAYTDWCLERGGLLPGGDVFHTDRVTVLQEYSERLDWPSPRRLGCAAGDEGAAIDSEGAIFPCDAFVGSAGHAIGSVRDGIDAERRDGVARWLLESGQHRIDVPKCRACFAKRFCGGGCYSVSQDARGTLAPLEDYACAFVREKVLIDLYFISRVRRENPEGVERVFSRAR